MILRGHGLDALATDPAGVLVAPEIEDLFGLQVGDTLPVTVFPDDLDLAQKLDLHVAGVFRDFPPTEPLSELVMSTAGLPPVLPEPDYYLARVAPHRTPTGVARRFAETARTDPVLLRCYRRRPGQADPAHPDRPQPRRAQPHRDHRSRPHRGRRHRRPRSLHRP